MNNKWLEGLEDSVSSYLNNLNIGNYEYNPAMQNLTSDGEKLRLGFSCFSLKIFYILGIWQKLDDTDKKNWINYINSFQTINDKFPENSYIDDILFENYNNEKIKTWKQATKGQTIIQKPLSSLIKQTALDAFERKSIVLYFLEHDDICYH